MNYFRYYQGKVTVPFDRQPDVYTDLIPGISSVCTIEISIRTVRGQYQASVRYLPYDSSINAGHGQQLIELRVAHDTIWIYFENGWYRGLVPSIEGSITMTIRMTSDGRVQSIT